MREFHKPVYFGAGELDQWFAAPDPAVSNRIAHETSHVLLERCRSAQDEALLKRLLHYTDEHGLETVAELWARSHPATLAGILWRVFLLRVFIMQHPVEVSDRFARGAATLNTVDPVVAGVGAPTGPDEVRTTSDKILRGVFSGDFAAALDRASSFCEITAHGCVQRADALDSVDSGAATVLTSQAGRLRDLGEAFHLGSALWTDNALD